MSTEAGRLAAYADLVAALLDLSDPAPSATFDGALDAAVADGSLTPEQARRLRWLQRESVRRLVDHARTVLPSTLVALESELTGGVAEVPDPAADVVDAATAAVPPLPTARSVLATLRALTAPTNLSRPSTCTRDGCSSRDSARFPTAPAVGPFLELPVTDTRPPTVIPTMTLTREGLTFMPSLRLLPDLEESIRQIPGVRAVSVVTDAQANPTEVHVLAAPGKPAKQVVRDVQSLAMAQFDIELDHRIVSVVQIEDEPRGRRAARSPPRPATRPSRRPFRCSRRSRRRPARRSARSVCAAPALRSRSRCASTLDGDTFVGIERGAAAASARARLVASATMSALDELLGIPAAVESAAVVDTGSHAVALVVLTLSVPRLGAAVGGRQRRGAR